MSRTVAIVLARMESTRLPGKVLMEVAGKPALWHIVNRLQAVREIEEIVIATGSGPANDPIREFAANNGTRSFSGSEEDVLDRFYLAAREQEADPVLRITGDCPLVDPGLVSDLIALHRSSRPPSDLTSVAAGAGVATEDFAGGRFPAGLDAEVIAPAGLERAWREGRRPSDREHVTAYIWRHPERFHLVRLTCDTGDFADMRWTLDYPEDLAMIRRVYDALYSDTKPFGMRDVLAYLESHPEVAALNARLSARDRYVALWQEAEDA